MSTLVVYFSRKGRVRRIAERTAAELGAELYEIRTPERTRGLLGFWWCGRFGMHGWPMPIEPPAVDVTLYDRVVICTPIWVFSVCAPVRAFLRACAGKLRAVDYILVHFSPPSYAAVAAKMDALLGLRHRSLTSIACPWGLVLRTKRID